MRRLFRVCGCVFALACSSKPAPTNGDAATAHDAAADSGKPDAHVKLQPTAAGAAEHTESAGHVAQADAGNSAGQGGASGHSGTAGSAGSAATSCDVCSTYATPKQAGMVGPAELDALSGLAMSRSQADILFAHNDHNRPVVYALDLQGRLHARITLEGAETSDIEDIAVGPCGSQTCIYLADIGDNSTAREQYSVLRFSEPAVPSVPGDMDLTLDKTSYTQIHFTYDDGSHNAESLMVAPNGNLYIITKLAPASGGSVKATGPSSVYRIDASAFEQSTNAQANKVSTLPIPKSGEGALSAAAAHPCGLGFVVRTYDRIYEFRRPTGADFEAAFTSTPQIVAMPEEPQSEAVDYRSDGRGFVTSGEGSAAPIMLTACAP